MTTIAATRIDLRLTQPEAQALADIQRQWRKAYAPDADQQEALSAVRAAAVEARRKRADAFIQLTPQQARLLQEAPRAMRNGEQLSDNQRSALTKLRFARRYDQVQRGHRD